MSIHTGTSNAPEGMEWQPGTCPNAGSACNCIGACMGKWVPRGTVKHCPTCACVSAHQPDPTAGCSCRSENGGSGICGCVLGGPRITA